MEVRFKRVPKLQMKYVPYNDKFGRVLKCMSGLWFEVETKYLFNDQFNIKGISKAKAAVLARRVSPKYRPDVIHVLMVGIRAFDSYCSVIVDDARKNRKLCRYCNHHSSIKAKACKNCGMTDHFERL